MDGLSFFRLREAAVEEAEVWELGVAESAPVAGWSPVGDLGNRPLKTAVSFAMKFDLSTNIILGDNPHLPEVQHNLN